MSRERERDGAVRRNGLIECLRLLFTFFVLMLHSQYTCHGEEAIFKGGWFGVEFFFLISGCLMAKYESKLANTDDITEIAGDSAKFIWGKYKRLFPYMFFAMILNWTVWHIPFKTPIYVFFAKGISGLLNFVGGYSAGFLNTEYFDIGYSWYISSMMIAMMLLFPLLRKNRKMFYCVYGPLIVVLGMGLYIFLFGKNLGGVRQDKWLLSNGVLRACFEISLGCMCYVASEKLKTYNFTKMGSYILSIIFLFLMAVVTFRVVFMKSPLNYYGEYLLLYILAVIVILVFSEKCSIHFTIGNKLSAFSGNFSFALYICSGGLGQLLVRLFPDWSYRKAVVVYVLLAVLCAFTCMATCSLFWKLFARIKEKMKRFIIE